MGIADEVVLFAEMSSDEVIEQLRKTDVFFLPSRYEAFPTVVLEAQAVGVPVVATEAGGTRETMRHGISGYVIAVDDLRDAVTRISDLFDQQKLREQFSKAGREFAVENFNISKLNRKLEQVYRTIK